MDRGALQAKVHRVTKSQTQQLSNYHFHSHKVIYTLKKILQTVHLSSVHFNLFKMHLSNVKKDIEQFNQSLGAATNWFFSP